jgi:uncharacterized protein YjiS (DUF1127 family)
MSLINLFVAARNGFSEWRKRAHAYDELMALDDRSLADIGIHRSQISGIVEGTHGVQPRVEAAPANAIFGLRPARIAAAHRWFPPF